MRENFDRYSSLTIARWLTHVYDASDPAGISTTPRDVTIAAIVRERSKSGESSSLAALARSFGVDLDEGAEGRWKDLSGSADSEARIWDELSLAAERVELRPTGNIRRKAELDAIRERIRRRDGEVTPEAFLRAVFGLDS